MAMMGNQERDIKTRVQKYILENFLFTDSDDSINPDESLIETNILDSTGIIELVGFIEEEFSISVDDEEISRKNFESIQSLVEFVKMKTNS